MPFESHACIGFAHAFAIVNDLYACFSGIADKHLHLRGSGINGILHQLLNDRRRSLNDFTGSYLVGYAVGEKMNDVAHG